MGGLETKKSKWPSTLACAEVALGFSLSARPSLGGWGLLQVCERKSSHGTGLVRLIPGSQRTHDHTLGTPRLVQTPF